MTGPRMQKSDSSAHGSPNGLGRAIRSVQVQLGRLKFSRAVRHGIDRQLARLRYIFRAEEIAFVLLGGGVGIAAGLAATVMSHIVQWMHEFLFGIEHGTRLSAGCPLRADWCLAP